jgi:hypothetical protein
MTPRLDPWKVETQPATLAVDIAAISVTSCIVVNSWRDIARAGSAWAALGCSSLAPHQASKTRTPL